MRRLMTKILLLIALVTVLLCTESNVEARNLPLGQVIADAKKKLVEARKHSKKLPDGERARLNKKMIADLFAGKNLPGGGGSMDAMKKMRNADAGGQANVGNMGAAAAGGNPLGGDDVVKFVL